MASTKSPLNHAHPQCANNESPAFDNSGEEIPPCGSFETQVGFDECTCLKCGRLTSLIDGHLVPLEEQNSPCNK